MIKPIRGADEEKGQWDRGLSPSSRAVKKGIHKMDRNTSKIIRATTILAVRKKGQAVMAGDGQVSLGDTIMKQKATKVRFMYKDRVLVGFAGAAADAFNLFERLEAKLETFNGNLTRAAVELAKDWRTDKILRRLEALLLAMDKEHIFIISGTGDVIEPDESVAAIGSGGPFALAAARALVEHSDLDADVIAREGMKIAASICVHTNDQVIVHELGTGE